MDLTINISTCNSCDNCKVTVIDKSEYLPEDYSGTVKGKFKFSDSVSVDVLQLNKSTDTEYLTPTYTEHTEQKESTLSISKDGWYSVVHLVLPSSTWFKTELEKTEGSALGLYNIVYYVENEQIYKYVNGNIQEATITEVIEINPINTTISKTSKDFVSICFLRKCYINLCQQIFNGRGFSSCWSKNKVDSELVFKRDLVWMALNVIKYLTECEQLAEVERIIETINGCNGLCNSSSSTNKTSSCGCSK